MEDLEMEPFIRSDQYNYIKAQTQLLVNGYGTVNDPNVLKALKSLAQERTFMLFDDIGPEEMSKTNLMRMSFYLK
jgi:hypothetical protein